MIPRVESLTSVHIEELIPLHLAAFSSSPNARLGRGYARRFLRWFTENPHAVALVARGPAGVVLGYVVGLFDEAEHEHARVLRAAAIRGAIKRPWLVFDPVVRARGLALLGLDRRARTAPPDVPRPTALLAAIGVAAEARGQGIGRGLVEGFERDARRRGARAMLLSVYPSNVAARALYTACGWRPGDEPVDAGSRMHYFKVLTPPE